MATLEKWHVANLDCHVITSDKSPQYTVILCHGYGAPGDDLVPIGAQLLQQFPELLDQVQFVFPTAPLPLDDYGISGGRAWWPLDLERLSNAIQNRDFDKLRTERPAQLPAARERLLALIDEICERENRSTDRILLGGFSQGAMLATDVAMQMETPPAALIIWSGSLINEPEWQQNVSKLRGTTIIQSHGRDDMILPYDGSIRLKDLLVASGNQVNFIGFRGPHTIPKEAMNVVGQLLQRLLGVIE